VTSICSFVTTIKTLAASRGFIVALRDVAPYAAAGVTVINPWEA
jgi:toxin FitB